LTAIQFPTQETIVALKDIDWRDTTYQITCGRSLQPLKASIQAVGLLQPPVLQESGVKGLRVVSGRRRLRVWKQLNRSECPVRLVPADQPEKGLFLLSFYEAIGQGELNTIERAVSLEKLSRHFSEERVLSEFLPLLGLPPKREILARYLRIAAAGPWFWPAVVEGRLFPEILEWIDKEFPSQRELLAALVVHLRWGYQKQREFLAGLKELTWRQRVKPEQLITAPSITDWLKRGDLSPQQQGEAIRKFLHQELFPISTKTEKEFNEKRVRMKLDPRTQLTPPPFFEGGTYRLEVRFSEERELRESLDRIRRALESGCFEDLP
jgi:ParB/Sulfiredoxin domain